MNFKSIFETMISGAMPDTEITAQLLAWEDNGITSEQLYTAADILRAHMSLVTAPKGAIDIVGTGGDGLSTYNISTACCFVVAGAGAYVAKHGNRAVSSKSGASDVLSTLGVKLDITPNQAEICIKEAGIGFLFAPNHHKAMGNVAKARATLGVRTIFNRLGPLCNPAKVWHLLVGVYSAELRDIYAQALMKLGTKHALIVHGKDGMDEITITAPTMVSEIKNGTITQYEITPQQYGLTQASLSDIEGGDSVENATALLAVLCDNPSAYTDIVLLNSGAALYVSGKVSSIEDGIEQARTAIQTGAAQNCLEKLIEISNA
ncbi:MAG: anthranilate phosphoribosyltransferase [Robiginitomaculum sp.]